MTPEERMARLKQPDRWTVNEVRADLDRIPSRRPFRFVLPTLAGLVAVAVAAVLVVGAVNLRSSREHPAIIDTPTATPSATPTATAAPTSTPSSIPTVELTGQSVPATPFGGDCSTVAGVDALTAAAGSPISTGPFPDSGESDRLISTTVNSTWSFAQREAGSLLCDWHSEDPVITISALILPTGVLSAVSPQLCGAVVSQDGYSGENDCIVSQTVNGSVLRASVHTDAHKTSLAIATKFVAQFSSAARAAAAPKRFVPPAGSWPLTIDCGAASVAPVDGVTWTLAKSQIGYDGGPGELISQLIGAKKDTLFCTAKAKHAPSGSPQYIDYAVYGGGAWVFDQEAPTSTPVTVPGFDHAELAQDNNGGPGGFLLLTRGPNLLSVQIFDLDPEGVYAVSSAVADALDSLVR